MSQCVLIIVITHALCVFTFSLARCSRHTKPIGTDKFFAVALDTREDNVEYSLEKSVPLLRDLVTPLVASCGRFSHCGLKQSMS